MSAHDLKNYNALFLKSANEHLQIVEVDLQKLSENIDQNFLVEEMYRRIHSLKGSSSIMQYKDIAVICTEIDKILHLTATQPSINSTTLPQIINLVKQIKEHVQMVEQKELAHKII